VRKDEPVKYLVVDAPHRFEQLLHRPSMKR
jgi:hypothetical protein